MWPAEDGRRRHWEGRSCWSMSIWNVMWIILTCLQSLDEFQNQYCHAHTAYRSYPLYLTVLSSFPPVKLEKPYHWKESSTDAQGQSSVHEQARGRWCQRFAADDPKNDSSAKVRSSFGCYHSASTLHTQRVVVHGRCSSERSHQRQGL